ncbi:uracil-DNA glycosylase [Bacillus sp. 7586-K]|uniref:uracil-DNA glycosylase n=1 Tax=Metabacillus niabensis TaxID=324854 RepID=UPI000BA50BA3|nr:uracil-DNA glycosylase [Bacillus sp. 7586-K]
MKDAQIICLKCKYFYITWDKSFPNGCRAYGFKSATRPAVMVKQSSGTACLKFKPKG